MIYHSGSGSEAVLEASIEPLALEGDVVVVTQGGEVGGAAVEPSAAADGKAQDSLASGLVPVVHQMWGAARVRAYNEVLGGELQPGVELLQGVEARSLRKSPIKAQSNSTFKTIFFPGSRSTIS